MSDRQRYRSRLATYFDGFVALRRASGAAYLDRDQPQWLRRFDRYLEQHWSGEHPLEPSVVQAYFDSLAHLPLNSRRNPIGVAWLALTYALRHGAPIEALPSRPEFRGAQRRNRDRYVFAVDEVARLRRACTELRPRASLRPHSYETLFGLLYATGIRVSEALGIAVGDLEIEQRRIFVRTGKFRKERLLPIRESTVEALLAYLRSPLRTASADPREPLFVSSHGKPIRYPWVQRAFRRAVDIAGIQDHEGRFPRIHDLRYTFAAHRLQAWYQDGRDVDLLLPALSTYLGHVDVEFTLLYLRPAAPLLREAADRFETACCPRTLRLT